MQQSRSFTVASSFGGPTVPTGNMFGWGENSLYQLGNGSSVDAANPVVISSGVSTWTATTSGAGFQFGCGLRSDASLWCWGDNDNGRTGLNVSSGVTQTPTKVTALSDAWSQLSVGSQHSCALRVDTSLYCWGWKGGSGQGYDGRLGFITTVDILVPTAVPATTDVPATGWTQVSAGYNHSCGIQTDKLFCWGFNKSSGQLGIGTSDLHRYEPVPLTSPSATGWRQVSVGDSFTCATRTDNTLYCWGVNTNGRLGIGSTIDQTFPTQVPGTTWKSVSAGGDHACALKTDDTAYCWGANGAGQTGKGSTSTTEHSPVAVSGAYTWSTIVSGKAHSCGVRTSDSSIWCWGSGTLRQLGDGTTVSKSVPTRVITSGSVGLFADGLVTGQSADSTFAINLR